MPAQGVGPQRRPGPSSSSRPPVAVAEPAQGSAAGQAASGRQEAGRLAGVPVMPGAAAAAAA